MRYPKLPDLHLQACRGSKEMGSTARFAAECQAGFGAEMRSATAIVPPVDDARAANPRAFRSVLTRSPNPRRGPRFHQFDSGLRYIWANLESIRDERWPP